MGNRVAKRNKTEKRLVVLENILMNKLESAADQYYGNVMAAIKLQKNKRLSKIPNGVFRCILEYQIPKVLLWRYSDPTGPLANRKQDTHFPTIEKLSYNNYLVAVNQLPRYAQY